MNNGDYVLVVGDIDYTIALVDSVECSRYCV